MKRHTMLLIPLLLGAGQESGVLERDITRVLDREVRGGVPPKQERKDPLGALITVLDQRSPSSQEARAASRELSTLGSLAVPSLLARLDGLSLYGMQNAFKLLERHHSPELYPLLEKMLRSPDQVRAILAARFLRNVPPRFRAALAELAAASKLPEVRLAGFKAQLDLPGKRAMVLQELERLLQADDDASHDDALSIVRDERFGDTAERERALHRLATRGRSKAAHFAIYYWVADAKPEDETKALELLEALPIARRERLLEVVLEERPAWDRMHAKALDHDELVQTAVARLRDRRAERLALPRLVSLLSHSDMAVQQFALNELARQRSEEAWPEVVKLLRVPKLASQAFHFLSSCAPDVLVPMLPKLDQDGSLQQVYSPHYSSFVRRHADPSIMDWLIRKATEAVDNRQGSDNRLLYAVRERSSAENWSLVLAMVDPSQPIHRDTYYELVKTAKSCFERWFERRLISDACQCLLAQDHSVADTLLQRIAATASAEDRAAIQRLLGASLAMLEQQGDKARRHAFGFLVPPRHVATECMKVLGRLGGTELQGTLLPLLAHRSREIAGQAFDVLVKADQVDKKALFLNVLGSKVHEDLAGNAFQYELVAKDAELRKLASERLLGWSSVEQPRASAFLQGMPDTERLTLAGSLLHRDRETKPVHPFLLTDALSAIGDFKSGEHASLLAIGLESAEYLVRKSAIRELGRTFSERAVPHLIEALKDDLLENANLAKASLERIETYLREKQSWEEKFKIKKGK